MSRRKSKYPKKLVLQKEDYETDRGSSDSEGDRSDESLMINDNEEKIKDGVINKGGIISDKGSNVHKGTFKTNRRSGSKKIRKQYIYHRKCPICEYEITAATACSVMKLHIKAVHDKIKDLSCELCDFATSYRHKLKLHHKTKHLKIKDHSCKLCGYATSIMSNLKHHVKSVHGKIRDFACYQCDYKSTTKQGLQTHVNHVHEDMKNFTCTKCNYKAAKESSVRQHIKVVHDNVKDLACSFCEFVTAYQYSLKKHVDVVHKKIPNCKKEFACGQCSYKTNQSYNLKMHVKMIHDKIKDLACNHCSYVTGNSGRLLAHKEVVHEKIRNFSCDKCNFRGSNASTVHRHVKAVHDKIKDFSCTYCEFTTAHRRALQKHVDGIHKNLKKYVCLHCDYKTANSHGLKLHVNNAHYKIKHLRCELCSYSTAYTGNLQKHVMSHHKEIDSSSKERLPNQRLMKKQDEFENMNDNFNKNEPIVTINCEQYTYKTSSLGNSEKHLKHHQQKKSAPTNCKGKKPSEPPMFVKEENELGKEDCQDEDSDASEESIIISDDDEGAEDSDHDIAISMDSAEEKTDKDCTNKEKTLVNNPFFMEKHQMINPSTEKTEEKSALSSLFKAFLSGKKWEKAPCDLCSFVGSSQKILTSHILERHVTPE